MRRAGAGEGAEAEDEGEKPAARARNKTEDFGRQGESIIPFRVFAVGTPQQQPPPPTYISKKPVIFSLWLLVMYSVSTM